MAAAQSPKVETLAQSMKTLDAGFSESRNLLNEQIGGLEGMYGSKVEALEGTKDQAFNDINSQATGRGMSFSGIPLHEQANYLSNQFLPGLTALEEQKGAERMQLRGQVAQLNQQQNTAAISRIDQQQSALNQWNISQLQIQKQAEEAEKQRQFTAQQSALDRQFKASEGAADRAATAAAAGPGRAPASVELTELFKGYKPYYAGGQRNYTEDYIIPTLMQSQGISKKAAENAAYEYRQRVFKEGR